MTTLASSYPHASIDDRSLFGHPRGLAYLAFTEMWERFSYYGMSSLVVLFMVQQLLLPGHVENVAGMASMRVGLEDIFGPLSPQALASQLFGLYGGLVYLTPILGGLIADRWLGAKRTVVTGVLLMTAGHFAMVFEQSFLIALLLLVLGSGCLKGNIAAQVRHLYTSDEESRATQGYVIFSTGINVGATLGPLVCGLLAQIFGWHVGFGAAGVLMLAACAVYLSGHKYLPDEKQGEASRIIHAPLTSEEWRVVITLAVVMALTIFPAFGYLQNSNVGMVWIAQNVDLATSLGGIPVAWFVSVDAFASILIAPILIALWRAQARRGTEPGDLSKIGIGAMLVALSQAMVAFAAFSSGDGKAGIALPVIAYFTTGVAWMWFWPVMLALVSRNAPKKIHAMMMGCAYLVIFVASLTAGFLGTFYEKMAPLEYWLMSAAIPATGAVLILMFGPALTRALTQVAQPESVTPPTKSQAASNQV
jgi:POT family proton-dependent oligopeptide transporter